MIHPSQKPFAVICVIILSLLVFLPACKVKPPPTGIMTGIWYISDELNIALRFETSGKGEYISTHKAVAEIRPFSLKQSGKKTLFRFKGRHDLRGKITCLYDKFYVLDKDKKIEFRQYFTKAFPKAPYRYHDEIFPEIEITEVEYGKAPGYYSSKTVEKRENKSYTQVIFDVAEDISSNITKKEIPLHMDIYHPKGDPARLRPLIILLHAGAFIVGDKRDELVSELARSYAQRGYVVASVNYRLGYIFMPGMYSNLERAMYNALQDVRAAIRYLSYHRDTYRVDPDMVFIGGNSAGGFLSLFAAFMDNTEVWSSARGSTLRMQPDLGCLDCSTNNLSGPFKIRGVINMWGALDDPGIIKPQDQIPILLIHGDNDKVVPYGIDYPFSNVSARVSAFFSKKMFGSASIQEHAAAMGTEHTLHTFEGLGHEPHFDENNQLIEANFEIIHHLILSFINNIVFSSTGKIQGLQNLTSDDLTAEYWIEQGYYKEHYFACDDCLILKQTPNSARVVWLGGNENYQLHVAAVGQYGQVYVDTINITYRSSSP